MLNGEIEVEIEHNAHDMEGVVDCTQGSIKRGRGRPRLTPRPAATPQKKPPAPKIDFDMAKILAGKSQPSSVFKHSKGEVFEVFLGPNLLRLGDYVYLRNPSNPNLPHIAMILKLWNVE